MSFRHRISSAVGWLMDRKVPTPLRAPFYRTYARCTGAVLDEALGPLTIYPSLGAFFVRRLREGARPIDGAPESLISPVDGKLQSVGRVERGRLLQAKGQDYGSRELLDGVGADLELEGARAWTLYLSPADYHRIHAPEGGRLVEVHWVPGERHSVAPKVLARREVLAINERCVLRLETQRGPLLMVLVGALNVGRIRVLGIEPGVDATPDRPLERGEELARFEMGSTVVVIAPPTAEGIPEPTVQVPATPVRVGLPIGRWP